ncbi:MAG: hypothetical protein ABJB85_05960 [Nitrososphaerota archaeon]
MNKFLQSGIFVAIGFLVVTSIVQILFVSDAYALARYFNCVTRIANGNGTMSLENVKGCYYKVFQGARDADADGHKIKIK